MKQVLFGARRRWGAFFFLIATLLSGCLQAAELLVAQTAPLSGPLAATGKGLQAGIELYFAKINATGGVHGATLRLVSADDGYKTPETVRLARELAAQYRPVALIGVVGTGNLKALVDQKVLDQLGIPLVGGRSGASGLLTTPHPWLFMTRASYAAELSHIVEQYVPMGLRRVAVLYQDDAFGKDGLASLEILVPKAGGEIVARGAYEKGSPQKTEFKVR